MNTTGKKHIREKKLHRELMLSSCSVIAYNQIDVIILRQHIMETAVIIRALTSSNTER